jgi:hypothetical protein
MRVLAAEITREKVYLRVHEELPYSAAVETTAFEDKADGSARIEQIIYFSTASILDRHLGRTHRELRVTIRAAHILGGGIKRRRIVTADFAGDLAVELRGVERRDRPDPAPPGLQALPECGQVIAYRTDHSNSCNDNTPFVHDCEG